MSKGNVFLFAICNINIDLIRVVMKARNQIQADIVSIRIENSSVAVTLIPVPMPLLSHRDRLISAFRIASDTCATQ